jgi:alkylation response protein AidB-like acyl-CoA dehydrogenase
VTLDDDNAALRAAVTARHEGMAASLAGCPPAQAAAASVLSDPAPCCDGGRTIPVDYILRGEAELRAAAAGWKQTVEDAKPARLARERAGVSVARRTLDDAIAAVDDRHQRYGPPTDHFARTAAMVNAAFGTTFTAADWALVMVLDKVARQRGPAATDDAAIDIAGYAACHQECRQGKP